jgi:L-ascorbate metabolism protein UlaG (beta-lactamase superfamily)
LKILFVGHNTFRITLANGKTLLTDPWFKNSFIWRAVGPALGPDQIGHVDYMLSSHNHLDHIDTPSLALAKEQWSTVIGSKAVAIRAANMGIMKAIAIAPGQENTLDGLSIKATPAFHPLAKDAIGFLIKADDKQIYFSGDTRADARLTDFLLRAGAIDLAFLQISCARYFGKDDGLNVFTAADLAKTIKAKMVVPMHLHARFKRDEGGVEQFKELLKGTVAEVLVFQLGEEKTVFG